MKKVQEIVKDLSSDENLEKVSELAAKAKNKASDLIDTVSDEVSRSKDAASRLAKEKLRPEELHATSGRLKDRASNFFSLVFYILKTLSIASLLSFFLYSARDTFFESIVMANLTDIDVFLGDVIPLVLICIIWFVAFIAMKRRFQSGGKD